MKLHYGLACIVICLGLQSCASTQMSQELQLGKMQFAQADYRKSFHELLPVAVCGNMEAQYAVGYMYYYGYGVPADSESGIFWMNKAAAQGYAPAIKALALIKQEKIAEMHKPVYKEDKDEVLNSLPRAPVPARHVVKPVKYSAAPRVSTTTSSRPYSLQLMGSYHLVDIKNTQSRLKNSARTRIWRTEHNGKPWYVLTYGSYASPVRAKLAMDQLPEEIDGFNPWVRNVGVLTGVLTR